MDFIKIINEVQLALDDWAFVAQTIKETCQTETDIAIEDAMVIISEG